MQKSVQKVSSNQKEDFYRDRFYVHLVEDVLKEERTNDKKGTNQFEFRLFIGDSITEMPYREYHG